MSEHLGFEEGLDQEDELAIQERLDAEEQMRGNFASAFGSGGGQRVLVHLAEYCHQVRSTYVPGDPYATANLCGRRDVFLEIMKYLTMDDQELIQIARQQAQRSTT